MQLIDVSKHARRLKAGLADAREGRRPYFWWLATVASIFFVAIAIDVVYQIRVFGRIYPFSCCSLSGGGRRVVPLRLSP